ncbi:hypothetical protein BDV96DRAFT_569512 [Lophiotrema nucula]|uniref:PhoD-like phosphatase domain-containing protein n=1 Tax=Lophiotrema nucula TaxID=690887 RepID=A0A6A5ZII4_9PLEO|nr:hypothetical protein BDV96DRAFT_569512 [Lophiotrema nucula]
MDSRNSGSYSSRVANPPLQQPLPDGYPQKRSSYRRPTDAQPIPAQNTAPLANPAVPSNAARPVAAASATNGVSRASSHRRRQSQHIPPPTTGAAEEALPAAPDVPRGPPPTSYRDPYAPKGSRSSVPTRSSSGRSRDPTIHINASRQQPNIQIAPARLQELRTEGYTGPDLSSPVEAGGRRDSQGRRPSVPDRSPLQKLEGKLDDISKEERRNRILEVELAAQKKAEAERAARRAREAAAKQQRNVSGPVPATERIGPAPGRSASNRRHVSLPAQSIPRSPHLQESDDDGPMYDISEPWDPLGPPGQLLAGGRPKDDTLRSGVISAPSQRSKNRQSYVDGYVSRIPSIKGKEPVGVARGPSFRERAGDGREQRPQKVERKAVAGPTGLGLYGVDTPQAVSPSAAPVSRYDSTRLHKDLPPTPTEHIPPGGRRRDSRGIMAAQMEMEQQRLDQKNGARSYDALQAPSNNGPTARRSVGFAEPEHEKDIREPSDHVMGDLPDVFHHEQDRRYVPPIMLEEWRGAPVATLAAEDLDLDVPEKVSADGTKKAWWEESTSSRRRRSAGSTQPQFDGYADEPSAQTTFNPPLYLKCGPLLRYTGIRKDKGKTGRAREVWRGSVMIVTEDDHSSYQKPPVLRLFKQPKDTLPPPPVELQGEDQNLDPAYVDPVEGEIKVSRTGETLYVKPIEEINGGVDLSLVEDDSGLFQRSRITPALESYGGPQKSSRVRRKDGEKIGKVREIPGVRLHAERGVTFWRFNLEIELASVQTRIAYRINRGPAIGFWVPARGEMMNIMFHSCNGFSLSVNSKDFCGPDPLWRDVLNSHQTRPFHVMLGGGDQIYNDAAMRDTTLFKQWTESKNPLHKHHAGFSSELQNELEQFYLDRYSMWFSQGMFGMANSQIPMVNIWDDHDIIDGFGSYPHHFMQTPVFTGLGAVAFKYYMLFQHQSVVAETEKTEPSWLLGDAPGPYIHEQSRSIFLSLGGRTSFLGVDCRTERQRDEILTEKSWDRVFDRLEAEIKKGETKHLIVLLGVPIAYPRLNFLENILTSRFMDPLKALGRAGLLGGFVNKFDGGVEILDDLDDHWTAKHHKDERNWFIQELQHVASSRSVRVTLLGGDVHLAAVGQFYTNRKLNIPKDKDHRYMPNVVSSAIVNTPPPEMMADIINKRNKIHHLDPFTDEDMIPLFLADVDGKKRNNTHLLPRRNWCSIREYRPGTTPPGTPSDAGSPGPPKLTRTLSDGAGDLVRRISSTGKRRRESGGPPVAYYNNPAYAAADEERAGIQPSRFSPEPEEERPRSRRLSISSLFKRRASVDSVHPPGSSHSAPPLRRGSSGTSQERPSPFHRRPSLLGKKGTLKVDGDFINLEGGLDICLNLEFDQKQPDGSTQPYRLLVPALDYIEPPSGVVPKERRKSRIGSWFGIGGTRKPTIGDDGHSIGGSDVGSESGSELGEVDDEERARQRYKVGPRILIPGLSRRRKEEQRYKEDRYANPPPSAGAPYSRVDPRPVSVSAQHPAPPPPSQPRGSVDYGNASREGGEQRRASAPISSTIPTRSPSSRKGPTYNSSHKSQLPGPPAPLPSHHHHDHAHAALPHHTHNATQPLPPEPKPQRRSMGGILNQHQDRHFEKDAHVHAHQPSTNSRSHKRESYPPHPAIVGAGPGSPYSRGGVEARDDSGYFASGGRTGSQGREAAGGAVGGGYSTHTHTHAQHNPSSWERKTTSTGRADAGVGAKYLGQGRYADDEYSDRDGEHGYSDEGSVDSFVPPKTRSKWKLWR